jgi:CheY-like chemotaxis protein
MTMHDGKEDGQAAEPLRKILFADDEQEILDLLRMTLEDDERYHVLLARDGEEALALCRSERPELVFLDLQMPKLNGVTVCEELRKDPATANTKIVILTTLSQDADIDRAMAAGADGYMTNPFSPTALHRQLEEALGLPDIGM